MSSLKKAFNKANDWLLKWPGLFGIPFYIFMFGGVGTALETSPDAGLIEGAGVFYSSVFNTAANETITGLGVVLTDAFNFAADTVVPGLGFVLSTIIHAISSPV